MQPCVAFLRLYGRAIVEGEGGAVGKDSDGNKTTAARRNFAWTGSHSWAWTERKQHRGAASGYATASRESGFTKYALPWSTVH